MQELPKPNPAVLFQPVEDGAVLLDPVQEIYFGTNSVGARIWQLLPESRDLGQLCAALSSVYPDVEPSVLQADAVELLEALQAEGLVLSATADAI
jgi:hypothetical protein